MDVDVFAALADPTRRRIVDLLRVEPALTAGDVAARFPEISRPAVSKHLRVLRDAGLCRARSVGRRRHYELDVDALGEVEELVVRHRRPTGEKLSRLQRYVMESAA